MKGVFDPCLLMVSRVHSPLPLARSLPVLDVRVQPRRVQDHMERMSLSTEFRRPSVCRQFRTLYLVL